MPLVQLQEAVLGGRAISMVDTEEYPTPILQGGDKAMTDLRYTTIRRYVDSLYPDYSRLQQRGVQKTELVELESCGLAAKNIRRYVLRYLQSGGAYRSVIDGRFLRSYTDYNPYAGKVRGPKRSGVSSKVPTDSRLVKIYEEAWANYRRTVNKYQYDSNAKYKPTLMSAYNDMILTHFSTINEKKEFDLLPEDQRPSYDRFYNWVRKKLNGDKVTSHAVSASDRRNNNRLLVGTSDYGVYNLMEIVEVDENEASQHLVSSLPGCANQEIGNAITYVAVDVLTHRIVGASVGFTNNSYEGFLNLMESMMLSDAENASIFGVDYDENSPVFPGCVLPREIRVDHGAEYTSHALTENLTGGKKSGTLEGVPITISLAPVALGSYKGIVERFFGSLHSLVQSALQSGTGYVTGTHKATHHKDAALTIDDFKRIVYEAIKLHNNSPIIDYPVTPSLAAALPVVTPNTLWAFYAQIRISGFDAASNDTRVAARYGLMLSDKDFKLSRRQISYKNTLFWDIGDDKALEAQALQLGDGSMKIDVRYDPRSVNTLYRFDKVTGRIYRYHLATKRPAMQEYYGMRWSVVDQWTSGNRSNRYNAIAHKAESRILAQGLVRSIGNQAQAVKGNAPNITTNRREFAQVERAAVTAADVAQKEQLFYGDTAAREPMLLEARAELVAALPEHTDDAIVSEVDMFNVTDLAQAFGVEDD